jgi:AICAR transformylase/IMP cyclohydrolase PurH
MHATEIEEFRLKLRGSKSVKKLLVSAGPPAAKERLLPLVARLTEHKVEVFATGGTARAPRSDHAKELPTSTARA